ncbi:hypothetical protein N9A94_02030 [Akkermansiaceae bacterium]|nr:hypothetical protein [Akkermansiaceae bacterium]MDB4537499.1 hypothetical protein [Akkermansiaceae bacterium]
MKKRNALAVGVTILTWSLGGLDAQAQRFTMDENKPKKLMGSLSELGPKAADVFKAWSVARIEGAEYFTKDQDELRQVYLDVGFKISRAVVEDRLQEAAGRQYFEELLKIGERNKGGAEATETSLAALGASVQAALIDKAKAETLTPRLNNLQWLIGEIALYAKETSALSSGKQSMIKRKLLSLEEKEENMKQDGEISDRERERLMNSGLDIWKVIVEGLREK